MNPNTNRWNRLRYTLYQPIYDLVARQFAVHRQRSVERLQLQPGERLLLLGAGTGLDLDYVPPGVLITAVDITPSMIAQLKQRARRLNLSVDARVMDGQALAFEDEQFDALVLHLIVAVIPDPVACLQEAQRVLKPGGRIAIMDKFVKAGRQPGLLRRLLAPLTNLLFSSITRDIDALLQHTELVKVQQQAFWHSFYRLQVVKPDGRKG